MANASWDVREPEGGPPRDRSYDFVRQMAAVYNPRAYEKDIVIELHFTDPDRTYQLLLGREKCTVRTEDFVPCTTRIETSFETWLRISEGKLGGAEAMMKKQYRVSGEFGTMLKMDDYFGAKKPAAKERTGPAKKTNMSLLLLPWLALWVLQPVRPAWGGAAGITAAALVPLLGLMALLSVDAALVICLSYLLFGVFMDAVLRGENPADRPLFQRRLRRRRDARQPAVPQNEPDPDDGVGRAVPDPRARFPAPDEQPRLRLHRADQFRGARADGNFYGVVRKMASGEGRGGMRGRFYLSGSFRILFR